MYDPYASGGAACVDLPDLPVSPHTPMSKYSSSKKSPFLFCGFRAPLRDVRKAVRRPPGKQPCLFPERRHIQCSFCAAFCQGLSMRRGCGRKQRPIGCALHFSPAIKKAPHPEGYGASGSGRRIRIPKPLSTSTFSIKISLFGYGIQRICTSQSSCF